MCSSRRLKSIADELPKKPYVRFVPHHCADYVDIICSAPERLVFYAAPICDGTVVMFATMEAHRMFEDWIDSLGCCSDQAAPATLEA